MSLLQQFLDLSVADLVIVVIGGRHNLCRFFLLVRFLVLGISRLGQEVGSVDSNAGRQVVVAVLGFFLLAVNDLRLQQEAEVRRLK